MTLRVDDLYALNPRFSLDDANRAGETWGANCGPGSVAAVCGLTLDELRPHMGDFERKGYTNPTLMWEVLRNIGARWYKKHPSDWPRYGLVRVQWEGPWTAPGVPMRVRYRHSHWIGAETVRPQLRGVDPNPIVRIFDINCMCIGGWVSLDEWSDQVVPWLLKQCEPKADGKWHRTHVVEIAERIK